MKYVLALVLLAVSLLPLGACSTINSTQRADPVGHANIVADKRIITDGDVDRYARIVSVNETNLPGDILKVQVILQNHTSFQQIILCKFEWFDLSGNLVPTVMSTWQTRTLEGKESIAVVAVAPTPQAKDFKLKLQESKRN
jgi:uncharacterized protein YcfL